MTAGVLAVAKGSLPIRVIHALSELKASPLYAGVWGSAVAGAVAGAGDGRTLRLLIIKIPISVQRNRSAASNDISKSASLICSVCRYLPLLASQTLPRRVVWEGHRADLLIVAFKRLQANTPCVCHRRLYNNVLGSLMSERFSYQTIYWTELKSLDVAEYYPYIYSDSFFMGYLPPSFCIT